MLDANVPHIVITNEGKKTKTRESKRTIPLVGISLEAMRQFPAGFPTYRFKDKISNTVNKFLRENELLETDDHTLYGLRHSFEDCMLAAGIDERIRRDLMGHSIGGRQRYGSGASLERASALLAAIAYLAPKGLLLCRPVGGRSMSYPPLPQAPPESPASRAPGSSI